MDQSLNISPRYEKRKNNIALATQQAIKAVDNYQRRQRRIRQQVINPKNKSYLYVKLIGVGDFNKVQLLPSSEQFYKIKQCQDKNYKMIITSIRGGEFTICVGYDQKHPNQQKNNAMFRVNKEIIINLKNKGKNTMQFIYIGIYSKSDLLMFSFRIQYQKDMTQTQSIFSTTKQLSLKEIKSVSLLKTQQINTQFRFGLSKQLVRKNKSAIKKWSPDMKLLDAMSKRKIEEEKAETVRMKKEAVETYRLKDRQLKIQATNCKKLIEHYQKTLDQNQESKRNLNQLLCKTIYTFKILTIFHNASGKWQKGLKGAIKENQLKKRFINIMLNNLKITKQQIPQQTDRYSMAIGITTNIIVKIMQKQAYQKSMKIVTQIIVASRVPNLINKALDGASEYRRTCRLIQRFWKTKFEARTKVLEEYALEQGLKFIKNIPKLSSVEQLFVNSNICYKLSIEYQADEASKVKNYFATYKNKIMEIESIIKINSEIEKFNKTALKKRQKNYLQVAAYPAKPQHKFFQNTDNLKAMVRGWLEIQYRKYTKKNRIIQTF